MSNLMLVLLAGAGASILGVASWWLRLRFLRHVYDHGGAADLAVASAALRSLNGGREDQGDNTGEQVAMKR